MDPKDHSQGSPVDPPDGSPKDDDQGASELYEKMSRVFQERLEQAGKISVEAFDHALRETREWAERMKENYGEDVVRVGESIQRDWMDAIRYTREQALKNLDLERVQVGLLGFLGRVARSAGTQLEQFADRVSERVTYKTGEIVGSGTLVCEKCGQLITLEQPRRVPPCPKCHHTHFNRSF